MFNNHKLKKKIENQELALKEANEIAEKAIRVVLSCKSEEQFNIAMRYYELAYKCLEKEIGAINDTKLTHRANIAIGVLIGRGLFGSKS